MTETESPLHFPQGQGPAHQEDFVNEEELCENFQAAARTSPHNTDAGPPSLDAAILKDIDVVMEVVSGSGMDSQKTELLSTLLREVDPRVEDCFFGDGQWNAEQARFDGAPRWHMISARLDKLRDETLSHNMRVELDLDEMLIDAFARGTDGFMSFADFQMMLAEADKEG
mmetsp:Transcript_66785/g.139173  ORF Transcript_66785/g.139173 Transcript_66785/m.139173 type:complete len:170 (-) Transcript_66785:144-653(-)|eukprot:CAMPEP_0181327978 /NCGR_PEP_ID=MMETSP1101-20121128/22429_1 /TAXON_ID=46948 /ORGANISM="Rhodomonas abbreviata, Strain Caron Lab Isolate" /LENGTH=169 /DNA_ID=CAMNT_0023436753 /DNA_START=166 /DNA_END=675 /DNA_ORIENTATION=+